MKAPAARITNEAPHRKAFVELLPFVAKFLFKRAPKEVTREQRRIVFQLAGSIHGPICIFAFRLPRDGGKVEKLVAGKTVRQIERLQRTAKTGGKAWANAWNDLTLPVWFALVEAGGDRAMPVYADVPQAKEIAPLLPSALKRAKSNSKRMAHRDYAVISIVKELAQALPTVPTRADIVALIDGVERIYAKHGLLPRKRGSGATDRGGLAVTSSAATLQRLIRQATNAA